MINLMFCLTDREAINFGLFLNEVLRQMEAWRVSHDSQGGHSPCSCFLDSFRPRQRDEGMFENGLALPPRSHALNLP